MRQCISGYTAKCEFLVYLLLILQLFICINPCYAETDINGTTELIRAIRDGETKKVDKLIESNSDINVQDDFGWTPLMYAIFRDDKDLAEKLIAHGADPDIQDKDGITPLIAAIIRTQPPFMLQYLSESARTPLLVAHMLIEKGADPDLADKEGNTPLIYATARNQESIVAALILNKANPNKADQYGRTPLFFMNNPDEAAAWAPADCKLASNFRARQIPEDQSRWEPDYAAKVAEAREQANIQVEQIKERIKKLLQLVQGTAPDANAVRSPDTLVDSLPVKTKNLERLGNVARNYARSEMRNGTYPINILIHVSADGTVKNAVVLVGMPYGASEDLQKAAMKIEYQPAMKNGKPVEFWDRYVGFGAGFIRTDF